MNDLAVVKDFRDCKTREDFVNLYWPRFQELSLYENEHFRYLFICLGEDEADELGTDDCSFIVKMNDKEYLDTKRVRELLLKRCLKIKNLRKFPFLYETLKFFSERNLICSLLMDKDNDDTLPLPYQFLAVATLFLNSYPSNSQARDIFFEILHLARIFYFLREDNNKTFHRFYHCVLFDGVHYYKEDEAFVHQLFRNAYRTVHQPKKDAHNQPDAWLKSSKGDFIPVEMKKNKFDKKALKQLERYIKAFDCKEGIAVGSTLDTELPDYIKFISISQLREKVEKDIWLFPSR